MESIIRKAEGADIPAIIDLSEQKRVQYEAYQPLFWQKAADSAAGHTIASEWWVRPV